MSEYCNIHLGMETLNQLTAHLTRCGLIFIDNNETTKKIIQNKTWSGNHRTAILIITSWNIMILKGREFFLAVFFFVCLFISLEK